MSENALHQPGGTMKYHYRLRIHFNNGFNPVTVPLVACNTFSEANEAWENQCYRTHEKPADQTSHIESIALLEGRKRPCFQRFSEGKML